MLYHTLLYCVMLYGVVSYRIILCHSLPYFQVIRVELSRMHCWLCYITAQDTHATCPHCSWLVVVWVKMCLSLTSLLELMWCLLYTHDKYAIKHRLHLRLVTKCVCMYTACMHMQVCACVCLSVCLHVWLLVHVCVVPQMLLPTLINNNL